MVTVLLSLYQMPFIDSMVKTNLIVGAGISGATVARLLADGGEKVTVIDKKDHIAGNCYDYRDENGIMIHKYGSHIFHTNDEEVWNFIRRFTDFNLYMHKVRGVIDGIETTIPFNLNSLHDVFPAELADRLEKKLIGTYGYGKKVPILEFRKQKDADLLFLADFVYEKVFLYYTMKQWGYKPDEVDGAVTARVPVYISKDDRYFQDTYQGIPVKGYTETIREIMAHPNIEIRLSTDYKDFDDSSFDRIFYTGPVDELCDYVYGELPYRSVRFEHLTFECEHYLSNSVVNYPCNYDFTRVHEYKYYLNDKSDKTVITKEYSENFVEGKNERYYPIPKDDNVALYQKYLEKAESEKKNCYFLGRLGNYKYYDMDKAIRSAMDLIKKMGL